MMRHRVKWYLAATIGLLACTTTSTMAQDEFDIRWNVREGNWTVDDNWADSSGQPAFAPDASFEEGAYIGNGGTAIADSATTDVFNLAIPNGAVDIRQGGSLNVIGTGQFARDVTIGGQGRLIMTGNGSFETGSQSLDSTGLIWLGSTDATVNIGGDLTSRGTLQLDINSNGTPAITGGGNAQIGGTVVANFAAGVTPQFGDSYQFLSGASSVEINNASVSLPAGVSLQTGLDIQVAAPTNSTAALVVSNLPVLTLNRATGAAKISNVVGGPLTLTSYDVFSDQGQLDPDRWSSLSSQGNAEWTPANPRTDAISELNLTGALTLNVGDSVGLGNLYNGGATHPLDEHATFRYSTPEGDVLNGVVEFEGPANDLVLNVNPESGELTIQNTSAFIDPIEVTGYNILSASGSLLPDNWVSFTDSGLAGPDWTETPPQTTAIAELNLSSGQVFSNGTRISLGQIFDVSGARDLVLEYTTADRLLLGTVEYLVSDNVMLPGDCNGDGVVNADDLACVQTVADRDVVLAALNTLPGDLDGNGQVAFPDFLTLSNNFGQSLKDYTKGDIDLNGNIAFPDFLTLSNNFGKTPGAAAAAVPEPASGALGLLAVLGLLACRGKRAVAQRCRRAIDGASCSTTSRSSRLSLFVSNSLMKRCAYPLALCAMLFVLRTADAEVIGINFASEEPDGAGSEVTGAAGVFGLDVWNNLIGANSDGPVDLIDITGASSGASVEWVSNNTWSSDGRGEANNTAPEGNDRNLMIGYLDTGGVGGQGVELTVSDVPYGAYNVIVYMKGGVIGRGGDYTIGETTFSHVDTAPFDGTYVEGSEGDYLVFPQVTGDSFTLLTTPLVGGTARAPVNAIEIRNVEPPGAPGDFNLDGVVDTVDFMIMASNYNERFSATESFSKGDFDLNTVVDIRDFIGFREVFNSQGGVAAAVPEPGSAVMLSVAGAMLLWGVRRRRR